MKKILIIAAAVVALPSASLAQSGLKLGAKLGLNISTLASTELLAGSKMGLHLGGMLHYGFGDEGKFGIEIEPQFSMKGAKDVYPDFGSLGFGFTAPTATVALNYIDIPVAARYRFGFGMYIETGFFFSLGMGATVTPDEDNTYDDESIAEFEDSFKGSDFGYLFGLGYIHESGFGIGYRYCLGLSDIYEAPTTEDSFFILTGTTLNVTQQLSLMYYFNWED